MMEKPMSLMCSADQFIPGVGQREQAAALCGGQDGTRKQASRVHNASYLDSGSSPE
jgi:hypothetical protein